MRKPVIRLPLKGAENVRDIGGYVGDDNRVGNFGKFIRANYLKNITIDDNEYLKEFGITDILDLRGEDESILEPDSINKDYFTYHRVGLLTKKFNDNLMYEQENFDMGEGYVLLLENKTAIKEIFEILAKAKGGVIYHCTAGKDRTGIVSMLILGLSGVSKKDIIANYEVTYTYLPVIVNKEVVTNLIYSKPEYIKKAIEHIEKEYGTYKEYLLSCNIDNEVLEIVKEKYLG